MLKLLRIGLVALLLSAAAPALAQYAYTQPAQPRMQPVEIYNNVARVNLGGGFYNSGYYNCSYYYPYYACGSGSYAWYSSFLVGPQFDFNLSGPHNLSLGFDVMFGSVSTTVYNTAGASASKSADVTLWEPMLDYVAKFGPPTQDSVGRLRVGGSMLIGPNSGLGGTFRFGGGWSFFNARRLGIGLDLVLEAGGYRGYWIGGLQIMASPEFHF